MADLLVRRETVSSDAEQLILVDSDDRPVGSLDKFACHDGDGTLHRAFSLFVFNPAGELLIQQRQADKRLWPSFWSNSCCSHPRLGEEMPEAVERRLAQELGLKTALQFIYKFQYQARYEDIGAEHELCSVYVGTTDDEPAINAAEVQAWRWISPGALSAELTDHPDQFTPWFKMEWQRLTAEFGDSIEWLGRH